MKSARSPNGSPPAAPRWCASPRRPSAPAAIFPSCRRSPRRSGSTRKSCCRWRTWPRGPPRSWRSGGRSGRAGKASAPVEALIDHRLPALDVPLLLLQLGVELGDPLIGLGDPALEALDVRREHHLPHRFVGPLGLRRLLRLRRGLLRGDRGLDPLQLLLVGGLALAELLPLLLERLHLQIAELDPLQQEVGLLAARELPQQRHEILEGAVQARHLGLQGGGGCRSRRLGLGRGPGHPEKNRQQPEGALPHGSLLVPAPVPEHLQNIGILLDSPHSTGWFESKLHPSWRRVKKQPGRV